MRVNRFTFATVLAVTAFTAAVAQAGTITGATGPIRVDDKPVTVSAGTTVSLKKGQKVETLGATVTYRSDTGDLITLNSGSVAIEQETFDTGAAIFLSKGSASGTLTEKTRIGASAGWIGAPKGGSAKVQIEPAGGLENSEALFRTTDGEAWVQYFDFAVLLRKSQSVILDIDPAAHGTLCFRTGQQNPGDVEIRKATAAGVIYSYVPKATIGCISDVENENKTKICNDINSLKTAKIHIKTQFGTKAPNEADIGPGTCAQIDNATGAIEVLFTSVKFEILERAISLTTEFATLAQSNFSDVK